MTVAHHKAIITLTTQLTNSGFLLLLASALPKVYHILPAQH